MTASRVLLVILDGIGDRPCSDLGGKTPLQAAHTPNLDRIAAAGICGIMDTIGPGIRPGSDTSHLNLLGYPPERYYTGRGPLEAEGTGISMETGMVGFRCNFATIDEEGMMVDRRAGRIRETGPLAEAIREGVDLSDHDVEFFFESGAGHRAAFALRGGNLGARVTANDPKADQVPVPPLRPKTADPADERTAAICNDFVARTGEILRDHPLNRERQDAGLLPANILLLRGAGEKGRFEPFETRHGLHGSVISGATLIVGIGKTVGLKEVPVEGATGSTATNLDGLVRAALAELEGRDFVLLNIKGTDEAGHDGNAREKSGFIERIDRALEPFADLDDTLLVVCADHSTPCSVRDHSADPVPLLITGEGVRIDDVERFDELACAHGGLHRIRGSDLMPIVLDLIDRSEKYGA